MPFTKALSGDKVHRAKIKNRAEECRCNAELTIIEKEKQTELRMLTNDKMRFIKKYCKHVIPKESSKSIASSDTRRSKDTECDPCCDSEDYQSLHDLLFTNDEIDIDKMLCLYLLCVHDTEDLLPPNRKKYKMTKENSPLERLIHRSKRKSNKISEGPLFKLPLYILETTRRSEVPNVLINDGRLASKILFNEKIAQILNTSLVALELSNKDKLQLIFETTMHEDNLQQIFRSSKIQDYLQTLRKIPIINSCESFVLKTVLKQKPIRLKVMTKSKFLEDLLENIHQNVLQLPSRKKFDEPIDVVCSEQSDTLLIDYIGFTKRNFELTCATSSMSKHSKMSKRNSLALPLSSKASQDLGKSERQLTEDSSLEITKLYSKRDSSLNMSKISIVDKLDDLKSYCPSEIISERNDMIEEEQRNTDLMSNETNLKKNEPEPIKFSLKQTTCEACMMKWKNPLPSPKTPRPKLVNENPLKTNSRHRLSSLINKEMFKLNSYDTRYSTDYGRFPRLSMKVDEKIELAPNLENVHISTLHLARIKQEIRDKETQKKLHKFLSEEI